MQKDIAHKDPERKSDKKTFSIKRSLRSHGEAFSTKALPAPRQDSRSRSKAAAHEPSKSSASQPDRLATTENGPGSTSFDTSNILGHHRSIF
jgi:hypothetical protein